ncbi:MAG: hypothetical protein ACLQPV_05955 [Vulcanimicrobiaceae bacterium]
MMQRSVVGNIYGYIVCLLAIVIAIHSAVGIVNGVFGIASPETFHQRGPMMGMRGWGDARSGQKSVNSSFFIRGNRGGIAQGTLPMPGIGSMPGNFGDRRASMVARARLQAIRGLVVSLVLLAVAAALFRWHWRWLQNPQPA